ncbi:prostaglandin G/H synthase 1-like isoform X1 [Notamacropus eugenii]|uniref:prostaglandin G/H synthase 1-like isoform X1 n=1 Tax=Notamacropus eugenii TaxID=9315 RepID=UPI003B67EB6A
MVPTAPPVDPDHIYGDNLECQHQLCLFKDGKLKFQMVDGEMYPPSVAETQVSMKYPANVPEANQMAVGQEVFGLLPGLMMYATIWLREHNRVCDILRTEHPTWNDEQLFQTTRLILIVWRWLLLSGGGTAVPLPSQIGGVRNINQNLLAMTVSTIKESQKLRMQSFSEYRKWFGLKPYTSFEELTGQWHPPWLPPASGSMALVWEERDLMLWAGH